MYAARDGGGWGWSSLATPPRRALASPRAGARIARDQQRCVLLRCGSGMRARSKRAHYWPLAAQTVVGSVGSAATGAAKPVLPPGQPLCRVLRWCHLGAQGLGPAVCGGCLRLCLGKLQAAMNLPTQHPQDAPASTHTCPHVGFFHHLQPSLVLAAINSFTHFPIYGELMTSCESVLLLLFRPFHNL
jgi:hypothetical protein